jgi:hypothetical protein
MKSVIALGSNTIDININVVKTDGTLATGHFRGFT